MNTGTVVILLLGILIGAILANAGFRKKFFKGIRGLAVKPERGSKKEETVVVRGSARRRRYVECPICNGTGRLKKPMPKIIDENLVGQRWNECSECGGSGEIEAKE